VLACALTFDRCGVHVEAQSVRQAADCSSTGTGGGWYGVARVHTWGSISMALSSSGVGAVDMSLRDAAVPEIGKYLQRRGVVFSGQSQRARKSAASKDCCDPTGRIYKYGCTRTWALAGFKRAHCNFRVTASSSARPASTAGVDTHPWAQGSRRMKPRGAWRDEQ
jgi:hypothetical protein